MRQTARTLAVLRVLGSAGDWMTERDLSRRTGQTHMSLHQTLERLYAQGIVTLDWRKPTGFQGRPQRIYKLTPAGMDEARRLVLD